MPVTDHKRHTRKARHLIRTVRKSRHASVQHQAINELAQAIHHRRWRGRGTRTVPQMQPGAVGQYRPLTHRAKQLLTRLKASKVWSVQKQLLAELVHEIQRGRRRIDKIRQHRNTQRAKAVAARGGRAIGRGIVWVATRTVRTARKAPAAGRAARHPGYAAQRARQALRQRRIAQIRAARSRAQRNVSQPGDRKLLRAGRRAETRTVRKASGQTFGQRARAAGRQRNAQVAARRASRQGHMVNGGNSTITRASGPVPPAAQRPGPQRAKRADPKPAARTTPALPSETVRAPRAPRAPRPPRVRAPRVSR